jgi:S-methylmethionine-dependent homocysteine/selenocysteine methylase
MEVLRLAKYRHELPQLAQGRFLTDGGLETTLIFLEGVDLPEFAAFPLLGNESGIERLERYYATYETVCRQAEVGFVAEAPTWRASSKWGFALGFDHDELADLNRMGISLLARRRANFESAVGAPYVLSGCIGPRDDAYRPSSFIGADDALSYHAEQIQTFADTDADLVSAMTLTHSAEAIGIVRAAEQADIPVVISFTVETDGRLPSGESLPDGINAVDDATDGAVAHYMINCAHPTHFESTLSSGGDWLRRLKGIRANASRRSHAQLDEAQELDMGDPDELADQYGRILAAHPGITVIGGCCGTDHRHIAAIAQRCT